METNRQDIRYEELYTRLVEQGMEMHASNKKRIKAGLVILAILPFVLEVIRRMTDSDKIIFLIVWVVIMFAISFYLMSVEYIDYTIQKSLEEATGSELDFDELFIDPDKIEEKMYAQYDWMSSRHEMVSGKLRERRRNRQKRLRAGFTALRKNRESEGDE